MTRAESDVRVYTLDQVAWTLDVTRRTLYGYIKAGHLKAVKIGKYWRVTAESLQDFLTTGTGTGREGDRRRV